MTSRLPLPRTDPTPIFEAFRGNLGTELLAAAVAHFNLFGLLAEGPLSLDDVAARLGLRRRAAIVLTCAMRAMGFISADDQGRLTLTPIALEHLIPGGLLYVGDYVGLVAESAGVREMVERLRTNRPAGAAPAHGAAPANAAAGVAFIYREGSDSAMENEASARRLTLALAGRARNVAPALAKNLPLPGVKRLLDVGGGTGIYSLALLHANPSLAAVVWDRPEVLKVAAEFAEEQGLTGRVTLAPGDMFSDPVPTECDAVLLSNILHDWDEPECRELIARVAAALPSGGRVLIHDVFLDDDLGGPLPVALYSASLFSLTEGRAYSAAEYRAFLRTAGLRPQPIVPTLVHCGVMVGIKD